MNSLYIKLLIKKYDLLKNAVEKLDYLKIKVNGESMLPAISLNEIVAITKVSETDIKIGDILLYISTKYDLVLHRVVDRKNSMLVMKGDNENFIDTISLNKVIGKMVVQKKDKYFKYNQEKLFESMVDGWKISLIIKNNELEKIEVTKV